MAIIKEIILDTSNMAATGEVRNLTLNGDNGAVFSVEINNEDSPKKYYNFATKQFQTTKTNLNHAVIANNTFSVDITFPAITDNDHYDIAIFAEPHFNTQHAAYSKAVFPDGSIDINSSTGSRSILVQKIIYQYTDLTLTLGAISKNSVTGFGSMAITGTREFTMPRGISIGKIPFSVTITAAATRSLEILSTPTTSDLIGSITKTIGAAPVELQTEDEFPAITNTDTIDGAVTSGIKVVMDNNVADNMVVGDRITTAAVTDTTDGANQTGAKIVMTSAVATKMAAGDRVTGTALLNSTVFTVVELNPDGDNANEFSITPSVTDAIPDDTTLTFTSPLNPKVVTVAALNPDEDNVKEFSMSEAIALRDGATLSFSNRKNYKWPTDIKGLTVGVQAVGTNVASDTFIANYESTTTIDDYSSVINETESGVQSTAKPVVSEGLVTTHAGNIIFNNQQLLALADDSVKFYSYSKEQIKAMTDFEYELSNVTITPTVITTTTTSAVSNSTSIPVAERSGILDNVSTISGIGINPAVVNPTVASGAGAVSGAGTIVASAAQTLEDGITLTFTGASRAVTIAGDIQITKSGTSDTTLLFDVENFLRAT